MTDKLQARMLKNLREILSELFPEEARARATLEDIGLARGQQLIWTEPANFWNSCLRQLDQGAVEGGIPLLVQAIAQQYPSNPRIRRLLEAIGREQEEWIASPTPVGGHGQYPTLTLIGSDRHDEFLRLVRRLVTEQAELCYASLGQASVLIRDPGGQAREVRQQVLEAVKDWGENLNVVFQIFPFRPHLLRRIVAYGPDGEAFELRNVPNTTLVSDILWAVLQHYAHDVVRNRSGLYVRTTVDRIREDRTVDRIAPETTLSEAGVRDGDELRVAVQAIAGNTKTGFWLENVLRVRAQIREYEAANPGFVIAETNDEYLPTVYVVEFAADGFEPPDDLDARPLEPKLRSEHRVEIMLPSEFPIQPPIALWLTPIFHPNVLAAPYAGVPAGFVCLGPLMDDYQPNLHFGELCQALVDMAAYRRYDAGAPGDADAMGYLNRAAARWAREEGQTAIVARGGVPMTAAVDEPEHRPLEIRPLEEWADRDQWDDER